jgi:hypothetical protein
MMRAESARIVVTLTRVAHLVLPAAQVFLPLLEHLLVTFVDVADLTQELRVVVRSHDGRDLPLLLRPATQAAGDDPGEGANHREEDDERHPDRPAGARDLGGIGLQAVNRRIDGEDDGDQEGQRSRQREPPQVVGSNMCEAYATPRA